MNSFPDRTSHTTLVNLALVAPKLQFFCSCKEDKTLDNRSLANNKKRYSSSLFYRSGISLLKFPGIVFFFLLMQKCQTLSGVSLWNVRICFSFHHINRISVNVILSLMKKVTISCTDPVVDFLRNSDTFSLYNNTELNRHFCMLQLFQEPFCEFLSKKLE